MNEQTQTEVRTKETKKAEKQIHTFACVWKMLSQTFGAHMLAKC